MWNARCFSHHPIPISLNPICRFSNNKALFGSFSKKMLIVGPITPGQVDLVLIYVFFSVSQSFRFFFFSSHFGAVIASGSSVSLLFVMCVVYLISGVVFAWNHTCYCGLDLLWVFGVLQKCSPSQSVCFIFYLFICENCLFFLLYGLQFFLIYVRFIFKILIQFKVMKWWNINKEIRRKVFELFFMSWALNFFNL